MGYYQGDYYRGDYYRGDPGLFSFFGKAAGGALKLGARAFGLGTPNLAIQPFQFQQPSPQRGLINIGGPGADQSGLVNIARAGLPMIGAACPKGHRSNKSTYVTRGGGTSRWPRALQVHPKGSTCVKSRRMNVANARALRRSIRRVAGFAKIVKRARAAISKAASAVGVHRRGGKRGRGGPSVRIVKAA